MDVKNDISEELRLLSAVVAAISRKTPYEVPGGYFLDLPARVLQQAGGRHVYGGMEHKQLTFSVPEGYFEGFAQQVLNRIKTSAGGMGAGGTKTAAGVMTIGAGSLGPLAGGVEHAGEDPFSSILAEIGRRTPYSVPEGYFEAHAPLLTVARGNNPYTIPADYFEGQAPLLAIARNNPYAVPAGYFDERATASRIAAVVEQGAVVAGSARVIEMGVREDVHGDIQRGGRRMNWLKYSAAAVVAGLILTVGFLRIHTSGHSSNKQSAPIDIAKTMSTVSDQELQNFLTVQGASPWGATSEQPTSTASTLDVNDKDLKTLLGNVPDGELKQYMEERGGANDIETN
jgi:hypothetical protein